MGFWEIFFGIVLIALALVVIVCVLMQSGKDKKLSSTLTGSADNFLSKGKSHAKDKVLSTVTTVLSIVFVLVAIVAVIVIGNIHGM